MSNFEQRLKREGLAPSTQKKYQEIIAGAGTASESSEKLLDWINRKVHARTPAGTILPMRAAVKHYLLAFGYDEVEVTSLLPRTKGLSSGIRHSLSPEQLACYHAAVEQLVQEPAHTILTLLPQTGLRISEACSIQMNNIVHRNSRIILQLRGKRDKERVIPLSPSAEQTLTNYLDRHQPTKWLFLGYLGAPVSPHGIRKYTRSIAEDHPELAGLSPHVLRHTFATMALRKGMDLVTLQRILGHENLQTTQRYLHPTIEDLQSAMDALG